MKYISQEKVNLILKNSDAKKVLISMTAEYMSTQNKQDKRIKYS